MSSRQLAPIGRRLRAQATRRLSAHPARLRRERHLTRAQIGLQRLAGLLPPPVATEASGSRASAEQIGGAYDYADHTVLLVNRTMATRRELHVVIAHELVHALEDQHFHLALATARGPSEAQQARRALIEGTATFVGARYDRRFQNSRIGPRLAISGQESVFAAGGETPFAVRASTIFDYVAGPLFVADLYRRAGGTWRMVDRALRKPPRLTRSVLQPSSWPPDASTGPIRLRGARPAGQRWRLVGGGMAGEETLLALLAAGAPSSYAEDAAGGWRDGRFEVWRRRAADCPLGCDRDTTAVMAVRLRGHGAVSKLADSYFDYALLGRGAERVGPRTWSVGDAYTALGTAPRAAGISFAPSRRRAHDLALIGALDANG